MWLRPWKAKVPVQKNVCGVFSRAITKLFRKKVRIQSSLREQIADVSCDLDIVKVMLDALDCPKGVFCWLGT